jgi:TrbL/VirB6 plasmid conjugal transfer protein
MVRLLRRPRSAVLIVALAAAVCGGPALAAHATAAPAHPAATVQAAAHPAQHPAVLLSAQTAGTARSSAAAGAGAGETAAGTAAGGVCGVPGIGDIGGLFGFCSQGAGVTGDLNNICQPSPPDPEPANAGIDSMVRAPSTAGPVPKTLYNLYGVAGQYWPATDLKCSDMTSLIGNNVAGMVFDIAKSIDRVTITVYQSAAGEGILGWLKSSVDRLITSLGNAIYFPYLAVVVLLGAMWLAWQGLIRKRGTRTLEGTIWMVVAASAAIWLIGRPADFTGIGKGVSDGISQTLNVAFSKLPSPGNGGCVPLQATDPQASQNFGYTSGSGVVDQNAAELWSVLVCKPWLDGELGTTSFASTAGGQQTVVNKYARQLLWAQAVALNEKPTALLIQAKQATYAGVAQSIQQNNPGVWPLFQGKEWTTRLEIAFAALFAAVVAGVLVLLIAVTLILLKLGFLLLLVVGPFFLLIGTHPGFGRVVALRWFELIIGVLLKQAAVALVLSVLLYAYALIMGTTDAALPWALKILMIALVTIAVFIYRRPFQHLFSAVGYGVIGSRERADSDLSRAGETMRGNTRAAATGAVPGFAAYRAARWARRNPAQAAGLAATVATAGGNAGAAGARASMADTDTDGTVAIRDDYATDASGRDPGAAGGDATHGSRAGVAARARSWAASAGSGTGRSAPPLNLPTRGDGNGNGHASSGAATSWARNGADAAAGSRVPPPRADAPAAAPAARPVSFQPGRSSKGAPAAWSGDGGAAPRASSGPPSRSSGGGGAQAGRWGRTGAGSPAPRPAPAARPAPAPAPRPAPAARPAPAPAARPAPAPRHAPRPSSPRPVPPRAADPASGGGRGPAAAPSRAPAAPASRPAGPGPGPAGPGSAGSAAGGTRAAGEGDAPATPFWLRPIRRQK